MLDSFGILLQVNGDAWLHLNDNYFMANLSTTLDNIVAHWRMEESSGTRDDANSASATYDLHDNNTVTSGSGKQGTAAQFTRANTEYLDITSIGFADSSYSFSWWVNFDSLPTAAGYQQFIFKFGVIGSRCFNGPYIQENAGSYKLYMDYRNAVNLSTSGFFSTALSTNTWYHIVIVQNTATSTFVMYLNGSDLGTITYDAQLATTIGTGTSQFILGSDGTASGGVDGRIDEFTITSVLYSCA